MNKILIRKNKKLARNGPYNSLKFALPNGFSDTLGLKKDDLFDMYYDYDLKIISFEQIAESEN